MATTDGQCRFEGCLKPIKAKGLCNAHYLQARRGDDLKPARERRTVAPDCSVPDCERAARMYGSGRPLCGKHHLRWTTYGDPMAAPKLSVAAVGRQAVEDAVASRDRSECWLDWSELDCWNGLKGWGGKSREGYPILGRGERVMWLSMIADGRPRPSAPGNHGLHSCDNPACWNPDHLRWGTHEENLSDRTGKQNYCKHCDHCNP